MNTTPNRADAAPFETANKYKIKTSDNTPSFEVKTPSSNLNLSILSDIKSGLNPAKIAVKMGVSKSALQYHLTILKRQGCIRKVGYGTWEVLDTPKRSTVFAASKRHVAKEVQKEVQTFAKDNLTRFTQDAIRAHAFVFTLQVPKSLRNWNNAKREQYLEAHDIPFVHLNIGGSGQRILVKDRKVWLTNPSIIIYDKASYFAEVAIDAKNTAIATHLSIIKHIERLLHVDFQIGSDYKFKVSRQHYAMIYNALAKQYDEDGQKMEIRTDKGVWFLIDNSYKLHEAETVHPTTAMSDSKKVQDFFNSLKGNPLTTDFIFEVMGGIQQNQQTITENQMLYANNIESHIGVIKELGRGVRDLTAVIEGRR